MVSSLLFWGKMIDSPILTEAKGSDVQWCWHTAHIQSWHLWWIQRSGKAKLEQVQLGREEQKAPRLQFLVGASKCHLTPSVWWGPWRRQIFLGWNHTSKNWIGKMILVIFCYCYLQHFNNQVNLLPNSCWYFSEYINWKCTYMSLSPSLLGLPLQRKQAAQWEDDEWEVGRGQNQFPVTQGGSSLARKEWSHGTKLGCYREERPVVRKNNHKENDDGHGSR